MGGKLFNREEMMREMEEQEDDSEDLEGLSEEEK